MPVYTEPQVLEVSIDRERVATFTLDAANALPPRAARMPTTSAAA